MRQSPSGKCETDPSRGAVTAGAMTAIRLCSELTAPIVRPCVVASAAPEMMLWIDAATVTPRTLRTITTYIIQPWLIAPQARYANVDDTRPISASRCGEKRLNRRPISRPCTSAETPPTVNSDQPFSSGPQPNLNLVKSTQLEYMMNCARPVHATTATSMPTPPSRPSRVSEAIGFSAVRHSTGRRRLGGVGMLVAVVACTGLAQFI